MTLSALQLQFLGALATMNHGPRYFSRLASQPTEPRSLDVLQSLEELKLAVNYAQHIFSITQKGRDVLAASITPQVLTPGRFLTNYAMPSGSLKGRDLPVMRCVRLA